MKHGYLLVMALLLLCKSVFAQDQVVHAWASGADQRDLSFGFTFQYLSTDFKIDKKSDWRSPFYDPSTGIKLADSLSSISSKASQGFGIGFVTRYRLTDHLEVRVTPTLVFADRFLEYGYAIPQTTTAGTSKLVEKQIQTTMVEFPLSMKLKSDRLGNFRAYILGGVKYSGLIGTKKTDANASPLDKLIKNSGGFSSYEAGIGCDIYFEYFKLSPELKISNSFKNILVADNQPYTRPIDKLFLHTIMFSLYFE